MGTKKTFHIGPIRGEIDSLSRNWLSDGGEVGDRMVLRHGENLVPAIVEEARNPADTQRLVYTGEVELLPEEPCSDVKVTVSTISPHLHRSGQVDTVDQQARGIPGEVLTETRLVNRSPYILTSD